MLVLGGQRTGDAFSSPVYISHLPMFMDPHNFQVIVRVTGEAARRYGDFVAHFGTSPIYTFKPKPFSIDVLDPARGDAAGRSISGTLFRGHFERGGSAIADDVSFEVEHVLFFRRLKADCTSTKRCVLCYLCFGRRDAAFMAHVITAPPDFDQVVTITQPPAGLSDDALRGGVVLTAPGKPNNVKSKLKAAQAFSGQLPKSQQHAAAAIDITVDHEYYFETGDLSGAM